jgi:hypothetical protein
VSAADERRDRPRESSWCGYWLLAFVLVAGGGGDAHDGLGGDGVRT